MNKQDDFLQSLSSSYIPPRRLLAPNLRAIVFILIISIFVSSCIVLSGVSISWDLRILLEILFGVLTCFYLIRLAFFQIIPGRIVSVKNKITILIMSLLFLLSIGFRFSSEVILIRQYCEIEAISYGVFTFGLSFYFLNKGLIQEFYRTLLICSFASTTIVAVFMQIACRGGFWHGVVFHYLLMWALAVFSTLILGIWYGRKLL